MQSFFQWLALSLDPGFRRDDGLKWARLVLRHGALRGEGDPHEAGEGVLHNHVRRSPDLERFPVRSNRLTGKETLQI